jgi:hypothetical protein
MKARGKRAAKRSASPLVEEATEARPEGPKYRSYYALSGLGRFDFVTRGDALRFASRLPLAVIFRAFGAGGGIRGNF